MDNVDLSNIDPLKWTEVRRRVGVLTRYDAMERPTAADRRRCGEILGLGAQQFANLHRVWATHRDALAIAPGLRKRRTSGLSRSKQGGVDPRARDAAREVIAELGPGSTLAVLAAAVDERCQALGIDPPSRNSIWKLGMEARSFATPGGDGDEDILVARTHVKLPVDIGGGTGIMFPQISIAVERPSGRILQLAMHSPAKPADVAAVAEATRHRLARDHLAIVTDATIFDELVDAMPADTVIRPTPPKIARRALADTLGRYVGRLELAYKPLRVGPEAAMQSARDRAPTAADFERALTFARDAHNAAIDRRSAVDY